MNKWIAIGLILFFMEGFMIGYYTNEVLDKKNIKQEANKIFEEYQKNKIDENRYNSTILICGEMNGTIYKN